MEQQAAAQDHNLPRSQAEYRELIAKGHAKKRRLCHPERQRGYGELEEMERNVKPIRDWIHPMHLCSWGSPHDAVG
ncbi:hypothetical protein BAE44_0010350 [Dichanthelium oligosanthes]|uniref:Uncharacterized protein n=1 Tax=Dichanthelium oligosanthes TaxID=888268 RepID=A0A1E5VU38_9POAL|nr:hypothetical protein BAE44_0010350 [Dichanthelium oligosanthes]